MQGWKCRSCELWCKEDQKSSEIMTINRQVGLTEALYRIFCVQETRISVAAGRIHDTPGIFQNVKNSMLRHCQAFLTTSGRNFEQLMKHNLSVKCFRSHECVIVSVPFFFFLWFGLVPYMMCPLHLMQVCRSIVVKYPE